MAHLGDVDLSSKDKVPLASCSFELDDQHQDDGEEEEEEEDIISSSSLSSILFYDSQ